MDNRFDPSGAPINCMACLHFDLDTLMTCEAFPDGIPVPILAGDVQHDEEIDGDRGIRFTPAPNWDESQRKDADTFEPSALSFTRPTVDQIKQALASIKRVLEDFFRDGVDQLLGQPKVSAVGSINGFFRAGQEVYRYEMNPNSGVTYQQVQPSKFDSYLAGYFLGDLASYLPQEAIAKVLNDKLLRMDKKESQCKKGTPCKGYCIPKGFTCQELMSPVQQRQVRQAGVVLKQADLTAAALAAGAIIGSAAVGGAAVAGVAMSAVNQRQAGLDRKAAAEQVRVAQEKLNQAIAERKKTEELKAQKQPRTKASAVARRVAASALEVGIPAAIGGAAGGPMGAVTAGAIAAGKAAANEFARTAAEQLRSEN